MDRASTVRERFARLARRSDAELDYADLEWGAIWIAAEEYPRLDVEAVHGELDRLGAEAQDRLASTGDDARRVEKLNRFLFEEEGFAGAGEYYDPRNSYLNEVLERRRGIPITLALVYIGVGRRAGLDVRGIPFPGHFLVRCVGREERIVDAFGGRTLTPQECELRLTAALGPTAHLQAEIHLRDATAREILVRMLSNLRGIFAERGDGERLLACCDRVLLLTPRDPLALRDRALVYQQLGWLAPAIADLDAAIANAPAGDLALALARRRDALRRRRGPLH